VGKRRVEKKRATGGATCGKGGLVQKSKNGSGSEKHRGTLEEGHAFKQFARYELCNEGTYYQGKENVHYNRVAPVTTEFSYSEQKTAAAALKKRAPHNKAKRNSPRKPRASLLDKKKKRCGKCRGEGKAGGGVPERREGNRERSHLRKTSKRKKKKKRGGGNSANK